MPHTIEPAVSGRAKCRACGGKLPAGELRFGERVPNPFGDEGGETTHWYHVRCAAFTRPEAFLETLSAWTGPLPDREALAHEAAAGARHRRLPRVRAAERSPTGRAACRACREPIARGVWRIALAFYEDGRFAPSGYIHLTCAAEYLETSDLIPRLRHFSPALGEEEAQEIEAALAKA